MKLCFWCGLDAEHYLPGMYMKRYSHYVCEACDTSTLQEPTKDGNLQLVLLFPIIAVREAVVLTGDQFLEHLFTLGKTLP